MSDAEITQTRVHAEQITQREHITIFINNPSDKVAKRKEALISLTRKPFYMTDKRKTEIIEKTLSYLINSDASDELLYKILH